LDWEVTAVFQTDWWYLALIVISAIGYTLLALGIYYNKQL